MKYSKYLLWLTGMLVLVVLASGIYFLLYGPSTKKSSAVAENNMFRYQAGGLEIGLATNPSIPRVGDNQLIVVVREPSGKPISVAIDAFAEMPAMGAMRNIWAIGRHGWAIGPRAIVLHRRSRANTHAEIPAHISGGGLCGEGCSAQGDNGEGFFEKQFHGGVLFKIWSVISGEAL